MKTITRINDWKNSMCHVTYEDGTSGICPSSMVPRDMLQEYILKQKESDRRTNDVYACRS